MRRIGQNTDQNLKGLRWKLLRDYRAPGTDSRAEINALLARLTSQRTARAWVYRARLREILDRRWINMVSAVLRQWCTSVMRPRSSR